MMEGGIISARAFIFILQNDASCDLVDLECNRCKQSTKSCDYLQN